MTLRRSFFSLALAAVLAGGLAAQETPSPEQMMEIMTKYATPGDHHKHLEWLVGTWTTKSTFWMAPGAPPVEATGKARHNSILGGRFVRVTYEGDFAGQPFTGEGTVGYDKFKNKYVEAWQDNMGTMMVSASGECDGQGKVRIMRGDMDDLMTGKPSWFRSVYRFDGPDRYTLEMWGPGPDGKEFRVLEIVHTRVAPALTPAELERGVKHLEQSRSYLVGATAGLSKRQWSFKASPERWSPAEIVEHLALSEDFLMNLIKDRVMKSPASNEPRDLRAMDDKILGVIADRTFSAKAPEQVTPTGKFASPQKALEALIERRARTIEFLKNTPDLRAHVGDSPLGKTDAYQWLLFISAHTERHTKQLLEARADPKFARR
ncbi:MAG: DUF1579 family protein [Acidobacteria bacterium]|nr:DUF1579 family protein [Acidobacteriota bacterium]